jgi:hypothetical protein
MCVAVVIMIACPCGARLWGRDHTRATRSLLLHYSVAACHTATAPEAAISMTMKMIHALQPASLAERKNDKSWCVTSRRIRRPSRPCHCISHLCRCWQIPNDQQSLHGHHSLHVTYPTEPDPASNQSRVLSCSAHMRNAQLQSLIQLPRHVDLHRPSVHQGVWHPLLFREQPCCLVLGLFLHHASKLLLPCLHVEIVVREQDDSILPRCLKSCYLCFMLTLP